MENLILTTTPPFLKWIGSKRWLKKEIRFLLDRITFKNYHEPFLGSGSVFFENSIEKGFLNDLNEELITTYLTVRDNPFDLIRFIEKIPQNEQSFYEIRNLNPDSPIESAARFIYLNKSSYNGLYRVNNEGRFNASYGKRKFDIDRLRELIHNCSNRLQTCEITCSDYQETLRSIKGKDVVFLDPPYSLSTGTGFTRYTSSKFDEEEQFNLRDYIEELKSRGAYYILTNEFNEEILNCFDKLDDKKIIATRKSVVSNSSLNRGYYNEVIYTNIQF